MRSKSFLDLSLREFLDCISDQNKLYEFEIKTKQESIFVIGSLDDHLQTIVELDESTLRDEYSKIVEQIKTLELDFDLSKSDVLRYLETVTDGYVEEKTKQVLSDLIDYTLVFHSLDENCIDVLYPYKSEMIQFVISHLNGIISKELPNLSRSAKQKDIDKVIPYFEGGVTQGLSKKEWFEAIGHQTQINSGSVKTYYYTWKDQLDKK